MNMSRLLVFIHYKHQKCVILPPKEAFQLAMTLLLHSYSPALPHCPFYMTLWISPRLKRSHCSNDRFSVISFCWSYYAPSALWEGHEYTEMIWALRSVCQMLLSFRRSWLPWTMEGDCSSCQHQSEDEIVILSVTSNTKPLDSRLGDWDWRYLSLD